MLINSKIALISKSIIFPKLSEFSPPFSPPPNTHILVKSFVREMWTVITETETVVITSQNDDDKYIRIQSCDVNGNDKYGKMFN